MHWEIIVKIISHRERKTSISFTRYFEWNKDRGAGFMFPCDEQGNLINSNPDADRNFQECLSGKLDLIDHGIEKREHEYTVAAIGRCECGQEVHLSGFTNTCECGADYNMSGSRLADRSQWGEETGESVSDILAVDSDNDRDFGADY